METLHVIALAITALSILYTDHQGLAYLRGKRELLSERFIRWSHRGIWAGLIVMILTGILLILPSWEYRLQDPAFYIKMAFVLVLLVNAHAIGTLSKLASQYPFRELPVDTKRTLYISGALSAIGWIGATIIGYFFL